MDSIFLRHELERLKPAVSAVGIALVVAQNLVDRLAGVVRARLMGYAENVSTDNEEDILVLADEFIPDSLPTVSNLAATVTITSFGTHVTVCGNDHTAVRMFVGNGGRGLKDMIKKRDATILPFTTRHLQQLEMAMGTGINDTS